MSSAALPPLNRVQYGSETRRRGSDPALTTCTVALSSLATGYLKTPGAAANENVEPATQQETAPQDTRSHT